MTVKTELENLFLRKKPIRLLMSLNSEKQKYVSVLAKETDCTYSHIVKLLNIFKRLNIVTFEKKGRVKYISMTQEGKEIAGIFETMMRKFSKSDEKDKK
ncbi:MAG: hypothetical protein J7J38_03555 [Candidatus Aenigmarchaeota archaeon]|nr:hypothetical protein [Candidatus Aenigmarchaeota archaeon]